MLNRLGTDQECDRRTTGWVAVNSVNGKVTTCDTFCLGLGLLNIQGYCSGAKLTIVNFPSLMINSPN